MSTLIATYTSIFLYALCTTLLLMKIRQHPQLTKTPVNAILITGFGGLAAHSFVIYSGIISLQGINLGFYNALSLISAFITLFTLVTALRYATEILVVVILPIAIVSIVADVNLTSNHLLPPGSSGALMFHVITSLIAYSILAVAALLAVILSIQNRYLHNHHPTGLIRQLPPLKTTESLMFEAITLGFVCLSISLSSGLFFLENMFAQQLAHKTILSIIAWFVFLILLLGRWVIGWRGRTAIRWTLSGFFSLMLAYFGSKFVIEILLNQ